MKNRTERSGGMNSKKYVDLLVADLKQKGVSKPNIVVQVAKACLGWPYAWGSLGQDCTVGNRQACMKRSSIAEGDRELIRKRCQILNGSSSTCKDCKYYPGGERTRIFDCRGFTRWVLQQVGITLQGAGATSQYNTASNWTERGLIKDMPQDRVCCVFQQNPNDHKTMEHTGFGFGTEIIHCSVEVKTGHTYDKGWTHYAVPAGLDGDIPVPPPTLPTLRKGDRGSYVTLAQTKLIQKGYSCGDKGADGIFGTATQNAVKDFQRNSKDADGRPLTVDGIIGQKTWWALDQAAPAVLYTITIPHLTMPQAEVIKSQYPGSTITEERGNLLVL